MKKGRGEREQEHQGLNYSETLYEVLLHMHFYYLNLVPPYLQLFKQILFQIPTVCKKSTAY